MNEWSSEVKYKHKLYPYLTVIRNELFIVHWVIQWEDNFWFNTINQYLTIEISSVPFFLRIDLVFLRSVYVINISFKNLAEQ